jgi:hypothetical protein
VKRLLAGGNSAAVALGAIALVIAAAGGAYGAYAATAANTITVCIHHNGGGLYQAHKCANHDKKLTWNQQGPQGATGLPGPQGVPGAAGAPAAVQVAGWSGGIGTIGTYNGAIVFAGPTATVTTTAADPTIVASGSASLGTSTGTAPGYMGICYQASTGGVLHFLDNKPGGANENVTPNTNSMVAGVSEVGAPGAGTWKVGVCVVNLSTTQAWDGNDSSIGWAMVTSGAPTSQ